ncbi:MAG: hypothetical protein AUH42_05050 [Gemmatimonadetes bacterium 13_1_40CM_70_11]|nr:MAG: hypothetical protein AUH42_05050 [Gemmatimonadetes bacterium 13_1_40CM_70_11]
MCASFGKPTCSIPRIAAFWRRIPARKATITALARRAPSSAAWFCCAAASSSAPSWIAHMPRASRVCGGESTLTSRPYALCHQLSSGAEVSIAREPEMHSHAPRGPRNPQKPTPAARSSGVPANVVRSTSHAHDPPASTPPR